LTQSDRISGVRQWCFDLSKVKASDFGRLTAEIRHTRFVEFPAEDASPSPRWLFPLHAKSARDLFPLPGRFS
jgi:hypothetical protein